MSTFYRLKQQRSNIYIICLALFLFLMTIQLSYFVPKIVTMNQLFFFTKIIALVVGFKFFILDDLVFRNKVIAFGLLIVFYLTTRVSHDSNVFYYSLFIIGAYDVDFENILKTYLGVELFCVFIVIMSCVFKVIPEQITTRLDNKYVLRLSLGFLTPTDFAARIFYLMTAYYAWRKLHLKLFEHLISLGLIGIVFVLTNSRLDFALMLLLWLIGLKAVWFEHLIDVIKFRGLAIFVSLYIFINILLAYTYNPRWLWSQVLNHLLSNRLFFGSIALKQHGVSLFGKHIIEISNGTIQPHPPADYFYVDSSYIRLLVISGILMSVFVLLLIFYLLYKLHKLNSYSLLAFLLLAIISSAIDQHLVEASYNIVLTAAFAYVKVEENHSKRQLKMTT
ncbi:hypothetical protein [Liquorilactobacillus mali]|uniref:Polysaccharide polymerase n=1 Tax=Liquorilactobacillus mali TaxID=1618 RepID=A0A0R2FEK2_9LACO|nr:hypothetical protein [Liquorilactobacillus mali]KRN26888.1 hypothetical protein IV36_GL001467 [Liquorilactobacillus mali]